MPKNQKILNFWFPVIAYSGIIFLVSAVPNLKGPGSELNLDKLIHFIEYIPFGFLVSRALWNSYHGLSKEKILGFTLVLTVLYALSDEYHQSFVIGRSSDWHDVLADSIGGFVGGSIYLVQQLRKPVSRS